MNMHVFMKMCMGLCAAVHIHTLPLVACMYMYICVCMWGDTHALVYWLQPGEAQGERRC